MSLVRVQDGYGHGIDFVKVDDQLLCHFSQTADAIADRFRNIKSFACRDDDIFICAPMKSGTHWTWEIVSMLVQGRAETIPNPKVKNMIEAVPHEEIEHLSSPRVLNSHVAYKHLPDMMKQKKCKIVYVLRNPKDMIVSIYHHYKGISFYNYDGQWEHFLPLFLKGELNDWFEDVLEWENVISGNPDLPIHVIYYEDLKENNLAEVRRLGEFLNVPNKDGLFEKVSEQCQFKAMRQKKAPDPEVKHRVFKGEFTMYRKGEIGDWKNYFTVSQDEMVDKMYAERMAGSKLKFRYTYTSNPA